MVLTWRPALAADALGGIGGETGGANRGFGFSRFAPDGTRRDPNLSTILVVIVVLVVLAFFISSSTVKIVQEYERGVVFRLGRLVGARGPGLFFLIPYVERMQKMDLRIITHEVPAQEAITRDNVTVKVNAVVYFRVIDPEEAVVKASTICGRRRWWPDHAAEHPRPVGPGSSAHRARQDQSVAPDGHRHPDVYLGRQSHQRRGARPRAATVDAARHGAPGRGRTREARQSHPCRGRVQRQPAARGRGRRSSAASQQPCSCATCRR